MRFTAPPAPRTAARGRGRGRLNEPERVVHRVLRESSLAQPGPLDAAAQLPPQCAALSPIRLRARGARRGSRPPPPPAERSRRVSVASRDAKLEGPPLAGAVPGLLGFGPYLERAGPAGEALRTVSVGIVRAQGEAGAILGFSALAGV